MRSRGPSGACPALSEGVEDVVVHRRRARGLQTQIVLRQRHAPALGAQARQVRQLENARHRPCQSAGIFRNGDDLSKAASTLMEIRERLGSAVVEDHSRTFNTERTAVLELSFMLDVAQSIVACALRREESRGAHQRTDFPARDDERFLAHSLAHLDADGTSRVEYLPVTITRWPPGERVYGR